MHVKLRLAAALTIGIVLGGGTIACFALVPRVSATALQSQAEAALPIGTPREKVEEWLAAQGMSWGDITESSGRRVGLGGEIENVYRVEFMTRTNIEFEFYFDEQDRLLRFFIEEDRIGL